MTLQQAMDLALARHRAGGLAEAEALYRAVLQHDPLNAQALQLLGVVAHQCGQNLAAVDLIQRALALQPDWAGALCNLGCALRELHRFEEATIALRRSIALAPGLAESHHNLGVTLALQGDLPGAMAAYRQALNLRPEYFESLVNLGNALKESGYAFEAADCFLRAAHLSPKSALPHNNLAVVFRVVGKLDEAVESARKAILIEPDYAQAFNNLGNIRKDRGELDEAIAAYRRAIALKPGYMEAHSNLVYTLHFKDNLPPGTIGAALKTWGSQHAAPLAGRHCYHVGTRAAERRLRIGYVSADFREHVVGRNLLPLFREHDRSRFDVTCYSQVLSPDSLTAQFQRSADRWRNIVGIPDAGVAEQIGQDGIDILVDLSLHLANHRLLVFARRPAPVQVTFAGYPGSTGLDAIDYRLSDRFLDPPGADESEYSEKTIRLPDSFWCFDPLDCGDLVPADLPADGGRAFTYGCLNNFCKVTDTTLSLWAAVLRETPGARLLLLANEGSHRGRVRAALAREGVTEQRVEFVPQMDRRSYMKKYQEIDLGLDTFPYNGHTTSLDSMWMGVPVVTMQGNAAVARAGWSQWSNLGSPEMAASKPEEFVRLAVNLYQDRARLRSLRATLRLRMVQSVLMDAPRFARNIEAAYREMWRAYCGPSMVPG